MLRNINFNRYSFKEDDDWGDYDNGKYRIGYKNKGYTGHYYQYENGKGGNCLEHVAKWEYFNGKIPDGMEIDHIIPIKNGGTNKLTNLRLVTRKENLNNPLSRKNNSLAQKGKKISEETKIKMSEKLKGRVFSNIHKEKLSKSLIGNKNAPSKKVLQYLEGVLVKEWASASECGRNGYNTSNVIKCCNGQQKKHRGCEWRYA